MAAPTDVENGTLMRVRYNVLPLFDIALGNFERGKDGATYLNGGMSRIMGFGGRGNVFKTFKMQYLSFCMFYRYRLEWSSFYDTEESAEAQRQNTVICNVFRNNFWDIDPLDVPIAKILNPASDKDPKFSMSNISKLNGTDWYETWMRDKAPEREKQFKAKKGFKTTPFFNIYGEQEKVLPPWHYSLDSLSEWHSKSNDKETMKASVGESESNHIAMTDNNHKAQMMGRWARLAGQGEYTIAFTVQLTDDIQMDKYNAERKLDTMKGKIKLANVPGKQVTYMTNSLMIASSSGELKQPGSYNPDTGVEEPMYPKQDARGNLMSYNDLKIVRYTQWRAKSGPTGVKIDLIFSQEEGLLQGLSEWHYLKEVLKKNPYGFEKIGNRFYTLDLLPDVKFERTTIRNDVEENKKLARAMTITAQLAYYLNNSVRIPADMRLEAKEIYQRIIDLGYDWDEIYEKTVDWWMFEEDQKHFGVHTLTIYSLLEMAADKWHPKFLTRNKVKKDKKEDE